MNYAIDILKDELNELCQMQYSPKLSINELTFKERRISLEKAIDELTKGQTLPIQNVSKSATQVKSSGDFRDDDNRESQSEYFGYVL